MSPRCRKNYFDLLPEIATFVPPTPSIFVTALRSAFMKNILLGLLLVPCMGMAQESLNMTLFSNWDLPNLPVRFGAEYNDCWGYRHSNGTEVAIIGGIEDIFFINVTAPANPVLIHTHHVENISGTTNQSLWRDFKTYSHYLYAAADEGDSGLLIFDLSNVPNSVTLVNQTNDFFSRSHNIFIDVPNGRLYAAGSNTQSNGLKVLDLATDPTEPSQIGAIALNGLGGGYVHDVYVKNNIAYCSHGSLSKLQMYDMNNLANISLVGVIDNYPEAGYNHSSWVNETGNMLVMADETQGSDLKLVDITDPLNISSDDITTFYSELEGASAPGASVAHNPFIKGDLAYIAYYHDGVQVFNIADPENIQLLAYYDTYENTEYAGYDGCWGVYPFFPSGIIVASDQNNGLFIMEVTNETLDIEFLSFEAMRKNENVQLQWTVADASFGNRFEVKRSADRGANFETIGLVYLEQYENFYRFLDTEVVPGRDYVYRIDFVEFDGNRIPSPFRNISTDQGSTALQVLNPVAGNLCVDILQPVEYLDLTLFSLDGKPVWRSGEISPKARMEFNIRTIPAGNYLLSANWPGGNENVLIQVIR